MALFAQDGIDISSALGTFEKDVTNRHKEKVYLHTDKSTYIIGETLWFKAYLIDAATHTLNSSSKVLYVQLVDEDGQMLKQQRVQLIDGIGKGQLFISPDITSNTHLLKAYTSWMRNNDNDFIYSKSITVINPSVPISNKNIELATNSNIVFFPEGGSLVYGIPGKVAVKVTNDSGLGVKLDLIVYDQYQNEVERSTTSTLGFANFMFTPEKGKNYYARIASENETADFTLPQPKDSGITLIVSNDGSDLLVTLNATNNQNVFVITHTRGVIKENKLISISGNSIETRLNSKILGEGISHITILDQSLSPLCERLVFKYPDTMELLDATIDKTEYTNREKVTLSLQMQDQINSNLSLSVYRQDGQLNDGNNILTNLLLTSDIKGFVENPAYYFDGDLTVKSKELDNLLLTQGWRGFNWNDKDMADEVLFAPEIKAPLVTGKVIGKGDLFFSFMGRRSFSNSIPIDSNSHFGFEVPFRLTNDQVVFWLDKDTLRSEQIELNDPYISWPESKIISQSINKSIKSPLEHDNGNIQISHAFLDQTKVTGKAKSISEITTSFYGTPEKRYNLDDYTRFVKMDELFVEYIRTAIIRRRNKQRKIYIFGEITHTTPALVLMDGVPVNTDFALDFDPLKVETIDIIEKHYQLGEQKFEGIINFITYTGDMAGTDLPEGLVSKLYHALEAPKEFYEPDHSLESLRKHTTPDFRNTLLWNPDVTIQSGKEVIVEFYTADDTGTYRIEINGITFDGQCVYSKTEFSVHN